MVGVNGIGDVPVPANSKRVDGRTVRRDKSEDRHVADGIAISPEAQQAASVSKAQQASKAESDIRTEKIAEAKRKIEEGSYKLSEVVTEVANRLTGYIGD